MNETEKAKVSSLDKHCSPEQYSWLKTELVDWVKEGLVSSDSASKISKRYAAPIATGDSNQIHWGTTILAILGSLLIGGGIILLFAHNWQDLGKTSRTFLSFLPLLIGQALCFYCLKSGHKSIALRESGAILLFVGIAASIGLIGQTYHIYGDLQRFVVAWLCLGLPIAYLMRSNAVLVFCSLLIIWLCTFRGSAYWLAFLALLPLWYYQYKNKPGAAFYWSIWFGAIGIALSIFIGFGFSRSPLTYYMVPLLLMVSAVYYASGKKIFGFNNTKFWTNPLSSLGFLGIGFNSLILTREDFWQFDIYWYGSVSWMVGHYFYVALFSICLAYIVYSLVRYRKYLGLAPMLLIGAGLSGLIPILDYAGLPIPRVGLSLLCNIYVAAASITLIMHGAKLNSMRILNGGLLWFCLLVMFRFFDVDISFVIKGIIFILIGSAFVGVNLWFSRHRKQVEMTHV